MRYIDVTNNNITQTVKAADLRFKSILENLINVNPRNGNLKGINTLNKVLDILDTSIGVNDTSIDKTIDNVINNINDSTVLYEGSANLNHIFVHNMNTEFFKYDIWILEDVGWQNSIVPITIIDENTVKVELSQPKSCRIILQNIKNITKTYGL